MAKPTFGAGATKTKGFGTATAESKRKEIGAVWERVDQNGKKFLSIRYQGKDFVAFKNTNKQNGSNQPDFIAFDNI